MIAYSNYYYKFPYSSVVAVEVVFIAIVVVLDSGGNRGSCSNTYNDGQCGGYAFVGGAVGYDSGGGGDGDGG